VAEDDMQAAIRSSIIWPEKMDDAVRLYNRWATRAEQEFGGFAGLVALGDRDTGQGIAIALYDSPEVMTRASQIADEMLESSGSLFAVPPIREEYDVIIHALPKRPLRLDDEPEFARVTTIRVRPETIDEAFEIVRTTVLANAQRQRGHRGFLGIGNRSTGKTMHVTFWDAESTMFADVRQRNERQLPEPGRQDRPVPDRASHPRDLRCHRPPALDDGWLGSLVTCVHRAWLMCHTDPRLRLQQRWRHQSRSVDERCSASLVLRSRMSTTAPL
jgi:hypothetical protein